MTTSVMDVGTVVLDTLPSHVHMWESDLKTRPMVVTHSDEDFNVLIPLSTKPQSEDCQICFYPNESNSLNNRCSPMIRQRIIRRAEVRLEAIGQLTAAEIVGLHRAMRSHTVQSTHFN